MEKNNFSIRTNIIHTNAPKRTRQCLYLCRISQLIKATDGSGEQYSDSYLYCNKTKRRLNTKHRCLNCVMYNPIINNNEESN